MKASNMYVAYAFILSICVCIYECMYVDMKHLKNSLMEVMKVLMKLLANNWIGFENSSTYLFYYCTLGFCLSSNSENKFYFD